MASQKAINNKTNRAGQGDAGEPQGSRKIEVHPEQEKVPYVTNKCDAAADTPDTERESQAEKEQPTLEEMGKYRAIAQQSSIDAIRRAEERYEKAKASAAPAAGLEAEGTKESSSTGDATSYVAEKGAKAMDTVKQGVQSAAKYASSKGGAARDTILEKNQQGYGYARDKAQQAYVATRDTMARGAGQAKDATVEGSKKAAGYAGQKAVEAKDAAVRTGWAAAHYTSEKAAEAAEAAAAYTAKKKAEADPTTVHHQFTN
ncbi:PREDICTED: seed biotin-containing protein SBP65-like isoform X2 [Nelumbo nucifera]|uniref:Seed biotin-containing protein SBP65-like isoform X2 n=1 Tax=Nelumbo nucifera TaxID=4432 RepID=A0A1U8BCY5_NELNU|nr:PREDICTED: seed biotin-containing protein SBP65-like isoform X2 [Nelumbo nucifera]